MGKFRIISFLLLLSFVFVSNVIAQDIITQKNGEKLSVNIFKIDEEKIYYRYESETIEYQILKSNVKEIVFKNGRKEVFKSSKNENTSFEIEDVNREYVTNNIDLENCLFFSNLSSKEIHVTVYGLDIKSNVCEMLSKRELIAPKEKRHRLAKIVGKGNLDHYSAFKIYVDEGHAGKIERVFHLFTEDLELVLWDDEMEIEHELEMPMSKLQIEMSPYSVITEVILVGKNGETVCRSSNRKFTTASGDKETINTSKPFKKVKMKVAGISGYDYKRGWFVFSNKEKKAKKQ